MAIKRNKVPTTILIGKQRIKIGPSAVTSTAGSSSNKLFAALKKVAKSEIFLEPEPQVL